jgi:hypothetical protein
MIAHQTVFQTVRRTVRGFAASHRIAALLLVVAVAIFGAAQWVYSSRGDVAIASSQGDAQGANSQPQVPYFPAQYVNQGLQPEKHVEGF